MFNEFINHTQLVYHRLYYVFCCTHERAFLLSSCTVGIRECPVLCRTSRFFPSSPEHEFYLLTYCRLSTSFHLVAWLRVPQLDCVSRPLSPSSTKLRRSSLRSVLNVRSDIFYRCVFCLSVTMLFRFGSDRQCDVWLWLYPDNVAHYQGILPSY